jgi:hypothetical protein
VTGGGYARQSVTFGAATGNPRQMANTNEILADMPTVGVVAVGIMTLVTGGALNYWVGITTVNFTLGDQARFAVGGLTVQED